MTGRLGGEAGRWRINSVGRFWRLHVIAADLFDNWERDRLSGSVVKVGYSYTQRDDRFSLAFSVPFLSPSAEWNQDSDHSAFLIRRWRFEKPEWGFCLVGGRGEIERLKDILSRSFTVPWQRAGCRTSLLMTAPTSASRRTSAIRRRSLSNGCDCLHLGRGHWHLPAMVEYVCEHPLILRRVAVKDILRFLLLMSGQGCFLKAWIKGSWSTVVLEIHFI